MWKQKKMERFNLSDAGDRGWFIGAFDRAIWKTDLFEVCYQHNKKDEVSPKHFHKVARELNLITRGHVIVNGEHFRDGDVYVLEPHETSEGFYVEDTYTICVKMPGIAGDKYLV